jgi:hypothetical protein
MKKYPSQLSVFLEGREGLQSLRLRVDPQDKPQSSMPWSRRERNCSAEL